MVWSVYLRICKGKKTFSGFVRFFTGSESNVFRFVSILVKIVTTGFGLT
jgi:hypothetical protein